MAPASQGFRQGPREKLAVLLQVPEPLLGTGRDWGPFAPSLTQLLLGQPARSLAALQLWSCSPDLRGEGRHFSCALAKSSTHPAALVLLPLLQPLALPCPLSACSELSPGLGWQQH